MLWLSRPLACGRCWWNGKGGNGGKLALALRRMASQRSGVNFLRALSLNHSVCDAAVVLIRRREWICRCSIYYDSGPVEVTKAQVGDGVRAGTATRQRMHSRNGKDGSSFEPPDGLAGLVVGWASCCGVYCGVLLRRLRRPAAASVWRRGHEGHRRLLSISAAGGRQGSLQCGTRVRKKTPAAWLGLFDGVRGARGGAMSVARLG
jgi:hypothetical protein